MFRLGGCGPAIRWGLRPFPVLLRALPLLRLRRRHPGRDPARRIRRRGDRGDRRPRALVRWGGRARLDLFRRRDAGAVATGRPGARAGRGAHRLWKPTGGSLEITVEVNPGDMNGAYLSALRAAGVNRLSIGAQAFDDRLLTALGRNHAAAAGPAALRAARAAGFDNVSVDLMFGVPGQSLDDWRHAVDALVALQPAHVSAYALTVERGTAFGSLDRAGRLARPDDEAVAAMFQHARAAFAAGGLAPYEVSSYARPGRQSRHNRLYWSLSPYLGVGASAASFRPLDDGTAWRFSDPRATDVYLESCNSGQGSPAPRHVERRGAADLENEALWLGLRTAEGVDRAAHRARHGVDPLASRQARD